MQQHAGTKGAIAETSTPNRRLAFSCVSAAVSGAPRGVHCICCYLMKRLLTLGHHRLGRADSFSLPEALAVRDEVLVVADVGVQLR
jgi:hypothetical protein